MVKMGIKIREKQPGSGEWWLFIHHAGRRRSKKVGDKATAEEAAKKLRVVLANDPERLFREVHPVRSFQHYSDMWMTRCKRQCKASTIERYSGVLDTYVLPILGKLPVNEIDVKSVENLLEPLTENLSYSSLDLIRRCIAGPINLALRHGDTKNNPTTGLMAAMGLSRAGSADMVPVDNQKVKAMTRKQVATFLETARKQEPELYELMLLLYGTGCRLGEALALTWKDVKWGNRQYKQGVSPPVITNEDE
jgi:integrase